MRRRLYVLVLMALIVSSSSLKGQDKQQEELSRQVSTFNAAIIHRDSTALEGLAWDELSYGHSSGVLQDKAAFIRGVLNGPNLFKQIDLQDQTIGVYGNTAIVRHIASARVIRTGTAGVIRYGNILIWQKRQGDWKLLGRQGYKVN